MYILIQVFFPPNNFSWDLFHFSAKDLASSPPPPPRLHFIALDPWACSNRTSRLFHFCYYGPYCPGCCHRYTFSHKWELSLKEVPRSRIVGKKSEASHVLIDIATFRSTFSAPAYSHSNGREHSQFGCDTIPEDVIHAIGHMDGVMLSLQYSQPCLMPTHCSSVTGAFGSRLWAIQLQIEWMDGWTFRDALQVTFLLITMYHCRRKLCKWKIGLLNMWGGW